MGEILIKTSNSWKYCVNQVIITVFAYKTLLFVVILLNFSILSDISCVYA